MWVPQLPDADNPDLKNWLPFVMNGGKFGKETIIIGHSAGGPLVLSVLESIDVSLNKAILVAGHARPIGKKKQALPILQKEYNWKKIKGNVRDLIFINSNNDPWGCNHLEGLYMWKNGGGYIDS